jgi:hypothetical protein
MKITGIKLENFKKFVLNWKIMLSARFLHYDGDVDHCDSDYIIIIEIIIVLEVRVRVLLLTK